jgi:hypothetical protein
VQPLVEFCAVPQEEATQRFLRLPLAVLQLRRTSTIKQQRSGLLISTAAATGTAGTASNTAGPISSCSLFSEFAVCFAHDDTSSAEFVRPRDGHRELIGHLDPQQRALSIGGWDEC